MPMVLLRVAAGLLRRLCARPFLDRDGAGVGAWGVIWWWEKRRIAFNLIVGATGLLTLLLCVAIALMTEPILGDIGLPDPLFALFQIAAYAIAANVLYTGGWFTELLVTQSRNRAIPDFQRYAFVLGTLFAIAVTSAPVIVVAATTSLRLIWYFSQP